MKIRLTVLTENNRQRPTELTEEKVKRAWQLLFDLWSLPGKDDDKCTVESVEFIESEE